MDTFLGAGQMLYKKIKILYLIILYGKFNTYNYNLKFTQKKMFFNFNLTF